MLLLFTRKNHPSNDGVFKSNRFLGPGLANSGLESGHGLLIFKEIGYFLGQVQKNGHHQCP